MDSKDLIRVAAERAAAILDEPGHHRIEDVVESALRETFQNAGVEDVLPCNDGSGQGAICTIRGLYPYIPAGNHSATCPAYYRPAVAALVEAARERDAAELWDVMMFVDKWFDEGDARLKNNPATRAADAREIALKAIEAAREEGRREGLEQAWKDAAAYVSKVCDDAKRGVLDARALAAEGKGEDEAKKKS